MLVLFLGSGAGFALDYNLGVFDILAAEEEEFGTMNQNLKPKDTQLPAGAQKPTKNLQDDLN